jgi:Rps23 Pro-64 3,4-dihydroxylase Tpa1-like proline 4-hydroxylase
MKTTSGCCPFRWWMTDNWCTPIDLCWLPSREKPIWEARYDNDCESGKRTTRQLPLDYTETMAMMRDPTLAELFSRILGYEVVNDETNHGGGLHVTEPGGWLNTHLDYDAHPHKPGWRRALNLIAFTNATWREEWGGALQFCDPLGKVVHQVYPRPGRLVAFEVSDLSYHGVSEITGHVCRVTVACYLLARASEQNTRQRALFMPKR